MSIVRLKCAGKIAGSGLGDFSIPLSVRPFALYPLATDLLVGTSFQVGDDLCGGAGLTLVGAPTVGVQSSTTTYQNCWTAPFTGRELADAEAVQNGATMIVVAKAASTVSWTAAGTYSGSGADASEAVVLASSSLMQGINGLPASTLNLNGSDNTNRGNRFAMYAFAWDRTSRALYERHSGSALVVQTGSITDRDIGSSRLMGVGSNPWSPNWTGSGEVSVAAFWPRKLSQAEVEQTYTDMLSFMGLAGIAL